MVRQQTCEMLQSCEAKQEKAKVCHEMVRQQTCEMLQSSEANMVSVC